MNKEEREIIINVILKTYEPLMEHAEHCGKKLCPKKLPYLPIVMPLLKEYGFEFVKEGEDYFIYKV